MRVTDRRSGVGASEVPAVLGLSPFRTRVQLYLEKLGVEPGPEPSEPMANGTALEPELLRLVAAREGLRVRHNTVRWSHPDWPLVPLYATPDGIAGDRLVEVKLVGSRMAWDWDAGVPAYVALQAQAQMLCRPKAEAVIVAALVGSELRRHTVERDEATGRLIVDAVVDFWRRVTDRLPPEPSDEEDAWRLLRSAVTVEGRRIRSATPDESALAGEYFRRKAEADRLAEEAAVLRRRLAEAAELDDLADPTFSGRWTERTVPGWKAIAEELGATPEQVAAHSTTSRTFVIRQKEAE